MVTSIENYLRSHFLRATWLAEKQPITGRYQHICWATTRARVFQTNIPFLIDVNKVYTKVIDWETLRTWGPKILLQAFESVRTSHQYYIEIKQLLLRRML